MRRRQFASAAISFPLLNAIVAARVSREPFSRSGLRRLTGVMASYVERGDVPGVVWLISKQGVVHSGSVGHSSLNGSKPMQRDTIFRIASMTKPVSAAAAMMLVEDCKIRMDEPIHRLIPELANRRVLKRLDGPLDETMPAKRPITLRDLLTFRLGIGLLIGSTTDYPITRAMREQKVAVGPHLSEAKGSNEWIRGLAQLPLMFHPGEKWLYHTGSDVLGVLIERASGQTLATFLRERIFEPLGMRDTSFEVPGDKKGRLAGCYALDSQSGKLAPFEAQDRWSIPVAFQSGGGGLVSTIDDYWAFARMMLNKGAIGKRPAILSRASIDLMTIDHLTADQKVGSGFFPGYWDNRGWGLGLSVYTKRDQIAFTPGTYGWDGGFGTSWYADPAGDFTGILMIQRLLDSSAITMHSDFWTAACAASSV
ncbi:MAG: serine hydrolase domain-containing protein [Bryobacteraceae bacterium]